MKSTVFVDMTGLISIYHTGIIHIQRFTPLSNAISLQIDFQNVNYGVTISFKTSTAFEKAASLLDFTLAVNYKSAWNTVIHSQNTTYNFVLFSHFYPGPKHHGQAGIFFECPRGRNKAPFEMRVDFFSQIWRKKIPITAENNLL